MKRNKKKLKQSIKLRERVENFLQKNPTAIKKIPPTDIRNLFEELQIYQVELENRNDELLKAQEQLQESEEKYRQLFATVSDAIMVFDAETREFVDANDAVSALYNYSREEFLELKHNDITAEQKKSDESINQTISGKISGIPLRYHKRRDGTTFPVEISSGAFKLGNRQMVYGVVRDITERKEMERSLIENMDKYRNLVDYSIDGIAVVQGQDIKFVNSALIKIFGYQDKLEMVGHKFTEFIAPEYKDLMVQMGRNREKGKQALRRYKFKALRNDGKKFDAEISVSRIYYQGKVARQGVIRDITKEKVAEDALRESEEKYRGIFDESIAAV